MLLLPNFPDGDIENLLEQASKKSATPATNASPERFIGKRQTSAYSDNLSLDMAEARWDILQTLLLEEREARVADIAQLRKELSMAMTKIQVDVNQCREVQKQMELRMQGFNEGPTVVALQEEFKSSLQQVQNDFALRIAKIQEKLEENIQQSAGLLKDTQPTLAITRVSSLERPISLASPRAERIKPAPHILRCPSVKFNPRATEGEDQEAPVVIHGLRTGYQATSFQASMPQTLQPSPASQTIPLHYSPLAWQCAIQTGSESTASPMQRTYNRNQTPMVARGIGVAASAHCQSQTLITARQMISKQETSAPQRASPNANFRMLGTSPADPQQCLR